MKSKIRYNLKNKRESMSDFEVKQKSIEASRAFLSSDIYKNAQNIMLYMPINNEIDTSYIIDMAYNDSKKVILPVTDKQSSIITPYYVSKNSKLKIGAFSIYEPETEDVAELSEIDVIIVPGIAFENNGNRVGFGKGCYDRLLNNTLAIKVGFCYEFQVISDIPALPHDIKMDYILTENGLIKV